MLQIGRVPEITRARAYRSVRELLPKTSAGKEVVAAAGLEKFVDRKFGTSPADRGSACSLRWPSAAIRTCCCLTNLPSALTWRPGVRFGTRFATWWTWQDSAADHALSGRGGCPGGSIAVIHQGKIIAEGTPAEIKDLTSGKRIRCITTLGKFQPCDRWRVFRK